MAKKKEDRDKTEKAVLNTYQKVSPSTYYIEKCKEEFKSNQAFMETLFTYRLNFPPKMFKNATLLEFGPGTGERSLFFLKWGASGTFVEINELACARAEKLFRHFGQKNYQIQNKTFFNFSSTRKFDIAVSLGAIDHTAEKERAFEIKARHLKKGGFLILGNGNSAGQFQRNLQRAILYHVANGEEEIVSFANELFSTHLDRAEKFGRRSKKAIIYDSYINPKIDSVTVSEILSWFSKYNLKLYSAWPPIIPAVLGDSANRAPLNYEKLHNVLSISEFIWLTHAVDDMTRLTKLEHEIAPIIKPLKDLVTSLNDITPDASLNLEDIIHSIDLLIGTKAQINPYAPCFNTLKHFLEEVKCVLGCLKEKRIDKLKECIHNSTLLFRGASGLGMNLYIGHKF